MRDDKLIKVNKKKIEKQVTGKLVKVDRNQSISYIHIYEIFLDF